MVNPRLRPSGLSKTISTISVSVETRSLGSSSDCPWSGKETSKMTRQTDRQRERERERYDIQTFSLTKSQWLCSRHFCSVHEGCLSLIIMCCPLHFVSPPHFKNFTPWGNHISSFFICCPKCPNVGVTTKFWWYYFVPPFNEPSTQGGQRVWGTRDKSWWGPPRGWSFGPVRNWC